MRRGIVGTLAGLAIGIVAILAAVGAAGAGHGTYVPAALCFPYTMAISALAGSIHPVLVAIALVQFPAYGLIVARAGNPSHRAFLLACVHMGAALVALFLVGFHRSFS